MPTGTRTGPRLDYARRRHDQLRQTRMRVPPSAPSAQRGWAYSGHMNAANQADEMNQLVASALVGPFLRFGPAACDTVRYWKCVFSRSSQTWADGKAFAHFERFLQTPTSEATFLDGAGGAFEDDGNLISAALVLEGECRA